MTVPSAITKANLDQSTDDPKQARAELVAAVDAINGIITHLNSSAILQNALGVGAGLTTSGGDLVVTDATTSAKGAVELAESAEVIAGTDTTRVITPAGLQALTATDARRGIIELATQAEVNAGTDVVRAVTPATLQGRIGSIVVPTSASTGEIQAQSAVDKFIRPDRLTASAQVAKSWGYFSGTLTYVNGHNVSSISSIGASSVRVGFTTAMGNANYTVLTLSDWSGGTAGIRVLNKTTTYVDLQFMASPANPDNSPSGPWYFVLFSH